MIIMFRWRSRSEVVDRPADSDATITGAMRELGVGPAPKRITPDSSPEDMRAFMLYSIERAITERAKAKKPRLRYRRVEQKFPNFIPPRVAERIPEYIAGCNIVVFQSGTWSDRWWHWHVSIEPPRS